MSPELKSKVVYLTADSDVEISELRPGETYIIGGIVDHNRYKNLCLHKAKTHGIRTAKLPIGTYLRGALFPYLRKCVGLHTWSDEHI